MWSVKYFVAILIGLFGGALFGYLYFHTIENSKFRVASWKHAPILVDCTHGSLKARRIQSAVDFWREYDHHLAFVELDPSNFVCSQGHIHGFIVIKNADLGWPIMGETTRMGDIHGKINSAVIELQVGSANMPKLLEHELGHAFGYTHVDELGHIMHPDLDFTGYNFWDKDLED